MIILVVLNVDFAVHRVMNWMIRPGRGEGEGRGVLGRRVDLGNYSSGEPVVLGGSGPGEGQGLERVRAGQAQYLSRCLNQVCTKIINRQCFHM